MIKKIAIDFDGVICKRDGIPTEKNAWLNREPMEGALDSVKLLINEGYDIWIFTSNPDKEQIKTWLEYHKFPKLKVTNIKEQAQVYIDDRALRFTNWQDIRKYFG